MATEQGKRFRYLYVPTLTAPRVAFCSAITSLVVTLVLWAAVPLLAGYRATIVGSQSMTPSLKHGDLVLYHSVTAIPKKGSVVIFDRPGRPNQTVIHRVVNVENGKIETKGDANQTADSTKIELSRIRGVGVILVPQVANPLISVTLTALFVISWMLVFRPSRRPRDRYPPRVALRLVIVLTLIASGLLFPSTKASAVFSNSATNEENQLSTEDALMGAPNAIPTGTAGKAKNSAVECDGISYLADFDSDTGTSEISAVELATGNGTGFGTVAVSGLVASMVASPNCSLLYVSGFFETIGDETRNSLAVVQTSDGTVTNFDAGFSEIPFFGGSVPPFLLSIALDSTDNVLYVGGVMDTVQGTSRAGVAALDLSDDGALLPQALTSLTLTSGGGMQQLVLDAPNDRLFLSGGFTHVNGSARSYLAAVDTTDFSLLSWDPSPDGGAFISLDRKRDLIYATGSFTEVGGESRDGLAAIDAEDGTAASSLSTVLPAMRSIHVLDSANDTLYLVKNTTEKWSEVESVNLVTGKPTGFRASAEWYERGDPGDGYLYSLYVSPNHDLYMLGAFDTVNGYDQPGVARFSYRVPGAVASTPESLLNLDINGDIYATHVCGDILYLAGSFTEIAGAARIGIAAIRLSNQSLLTWYPTGGVSGSVYAITSDSECTELFLAGNFTEIGGAERNSLAVVSVDTAEVGALSVDMDGPIGTLYLYQGESSNYSDWHLYAGNGSAYDNGGFTTVNDEARAGMFSLALNDNSLDPWTPPIDKTGSDPHVYAISVDESRRVMYVGGDFDEVDSTARTGLAAFDLDSKELLNWSPSIDGGFLRVIDIKVNQANREVYVSGAFSSVNTETRKGFAAFSMMGELTPLEISNVESETLNTYVCGQISIDSRRNVLYGTTGVTQDLDSFFAVDLVTNTASVVATGDISVVRPVVTNAHDVVVSGGFSEIGGSSLANLARFKFIPDVPE